MSRELVLTGLDGSQPLGFLAALGVLKSLAESETTGGLVRMRWPESVPRQPIIIADNIANAADLTHALLERQADRPNAPELTWADDIRVAPDEFAAACRGMDDHPAALGFMAAFGSDAINNGERLTPTPFYMISGQQRLLRMARELAASLVDGKSNRAAEAFTEALFGPWRYTDPYHSFGWDPAAERLHALRAIRPTDEQPLGVRAAIWLAFEGLALLPSVPGGRKLRTAGFDANRAFTWPLWQPALTLEAVYTLLGHRDIVQRGITRELRARGVLAVFRSQRVPGAKGYAAFRPAALVIDQ